MATKADFPGETEDSSGEPTRTAPAPAVADSSLSLAYPVLPMATELPIPWKALVLGEPGRAAVLTDTDHTNESYKKGEPERLSLCIFKALEFKEKVGTFFSLNHQCGGKKERKHLISISLLPQIIRIKSYFLPCTL